MYKRKFSSASGSGSTKKLKVEHLTGPEFYKALEPFILTENQLKVNKYPRPDPKKDEYAVFFGDRTNITGNEKVCRRCRKTFEVDPNGKYVKEEKCVYHWRNPVTNRRGTIYYCCSGNYYTKGCQEAKVHVHDFNEKTDLSGYLKTKPISKPDDGDFGAYAIDCEMVFTTMGMELAKVTVMGADYEVAYDTYVKPDNPVLDYNTRFSGIREVDMKDVQTSIRDVHTKLAGLLNDKTILIGHSLEHDLISLKLIHNTVVDTSIVFPHDRGLPFKRALRDLVSSYLNKSIQGQATGHDSQEDARSCLQLMQYKLK